MTDLQELMALLEKWRLQSDPYHRKCADELETILRSPAFAEMALDRARLDYIERTFSGMTNRERYLPVQMIWGKGAMGRTLREACDKYMNRDEAIDAQRHGRGESSK
jgi:hypothetical protein